MKQLTLWDFIPEPEDGELSESFLIFKNEYRLFSMEFNIPKDRIFKKWISHEKKKEPQNSFFCHESVFLKGLKEMFKRKRRS